MNFTKEELDIIYKAVNYYSVFYPFGEDLRYTILKKLEIMKSTANISNDDYSE